MTKTINGDWIMEKDEVIDGDLIVTGNISGKDGSRFNLRVEGNITAYNIVAGNINARNIDAWNINAGNIDALGINARDINAGDINARDIDALNMDIRDLIFWAVAIAYKSFKCKTWKARRDNFVIKCLDGEVQGEKK